MNFLLLLIKLRLLLKNVRARTFLIKITLLHPVFVLCLLQRWQRAKIKIAWRYSIFSFDATSTLSFKQEYFLWLLAADTSQASVVFLLTSKLPKMTQHVAISSLLSKTCHVRIIREKSYISTHTLLILTLNFACFHPHSLFSQNFCLYYTKGENHIWKAKTFMHSMRSLFCSVARK